MVQDKRKPNSYQQAGVYCLHLTMRSQMQVNVPDLQSFGGCSRLHSSGDCYSDILHWHTTKDTEMQKTVENHKRLKRASPFDQMLLTTVHMFLFELLDIFHSKEYNDCN